VGRRAEYLVLLDDRDIESLLGQEQSRVEARRTTADDDDVAHEHRYYPTWLAARD
jgi:hypothetical protein